MNSNIGIMSQGTVAWDGTTAYAKDIRKHTTFGWNFEVTADIAADAVFTIQTAAPSDADPCVPDAFTDMPAIAVCSDEGDPGLATVTIPAGTVAGTVCAGTVPCRGEGFVQLAATSGDTANVLAVLVRHAPMF